MLVGRNILPLTLGPELSVPSTACPGYTVRINKDVLKSVAFIGYSDGDTFLAKGTGFFVSHKGFIYFVTAKHVASQLGDAPFCVRANGADTGITATIDPLEGYRWYFHSDVSVDVAVGNCGSDWTFLDHVREIPSSMFYEGYERDIDNVGVGTETHTVGLFRLMSGKRRNLPVVHAGSIAMMSEDELVPVKDWDEIGGAKHIEAHLVEQISLSGLSGAPVFCTRPMAGPSPKGKQINLLGLWHGAWDSPPGEVLSAEHGKDVRVPVGIGVVVPVKKILEVLDMDEMEQARNQVRRRAEMEALPQPDVISEDNLGDGDEVLRRMLKTPPKRN